MGVVIAVSQSKGGSAKTTTSVNLGGALLERGYKVIVCDMDKDKPDAVEWAKQGESMNFVVPLFEDKPIEQIEYYKKNYDYIILDTPPNYMPAAFKAIMLADFVVLPCSPSFLDQNNLADAISVAQMSSKPFKILGVKIRKRHNLSVSLLSELDKSNFAFNTKITLKSALIESPFHGKWVGDYQNNCESHAEFKQLAEEVVTCFPCGNIDIELKARSS